MPANRATGVPHCHRRRLLLFVALATLLVACLSPTHAAASSPADEAPAWQPLALDSTLTIEQAKAQLERANVDRAALGYAYALPPFLHLRQRYLWTLGMRQMHPESAAGPFGHWFLMRDPASPATTDPSPNRDTLYGATFLDLGATPYVLSVPDIPGRYWSIAMLDAHFYNFEYVGSRTTGQAAANYLIVGPQWNGTAPVGIAQVIRAPTPSINLYQRIYFRDEADLPTVRALQDRIVLTPLAKFLDPDAAPATGDIARVLAVNPLAARDPVQMFEMANAYLAANPGPATDAALLAHLRPAGVGPGVAVPADEAARSILRRGAAEAARTLAAMSVSGQTIVNGWQIPPQDVGRRGGADKTYVHALSQVRTIGLNVPEEATYYTTYTDGEGHALSGAKRYVLRFEKGAAPPILADRFGFWSLTLYDREKYLMVANPANKYLVRSGDPLVRAKDGSITLYLQPEPPQDAALRANWLPTPAARDFTLNLRVYLGGPAVVYGRYAPPPIREAR